MKTILLTSLGLMILVSGCMSEKALITRHYTIEWSDDRKEADGEDKSVIRGRCEIDPIQISPLYERMQIVNRSGSHEITYYKYHQWALRPSVAAMEVIRTYLEGANLFESVSTRYSRAIPDYRFSTTIRQLEVIESKTQFQAHLHLEFRIIDNSDDRILVEHRADRTEPLAEKELNLFASTISDILVSELRAFEARVRNQPEAFVPETP
jgi:ABC-type uncharacterized transport system auxiliary subunit